jgi:hypothetical protein
MLSISVAAAGERVKGIGRWQEEHDTGERLQAMTAEQLLSMPRAIPWCWSHESCVPPEHDYEVEAERFDSVGKVLEWTLHLGGKTWFDIEGWAVTVRRFYDLPDA